MVMRNPARTYAPELNAMLDKMPPEVAAFAVQWFDDPSFDLVDSEGRSCRCPDGCDPEWEASDAENAFLCAFEKAVEARWASASEKMEKKYADVAERHGVDIETAREICFHETLAKSDKARAAASLQHFMARAGLNVHASGVKVDYIIEAIVKAAVREARIEQIVKETQCEQEVEGLLTELTEITEQIEGAVESLDKTLAPLGEEPADNDESQRSS